MRQILLIAVILFVASQTLVAKPKKKKENDNAVGPSPVDVQIKVTDVDKVVMTAPEVTGELKQWHRVTLSFTGPKTSEAAEINPFLHYRLNVTFTKDGKSFKVPGYFAADGNAAETSATEGDKWRVHFAAPEAGKWQWKASFRKGAYIAIDLNDAAGISVSFDGLSGEIDLKPTDKKGRDIRAKGQLKLTGGHYPQFATSGEYMIKQGPDAPENLLAYRDFDGDFKTDGPVTKRRKYDQFIKDYKPHVKDWHEGDPTWQNGKGKGLVGAINYLASEGMNVFSFLPMNVGGDDRNVFPYTTYSERFRFDCSKLDQWEIVLSHGTKMGFFLHFKTQETENDHLLDDGALGVERKVYYRELVARFAHHLALNWNLGEETTNSTAQIKAYCDYFEAIDPYGHPVVIHTFPNQQDKRYGPLLGYKNFDGLSVQTSKTDFVNVHKDVARWVKASAKHGHKWIVACDEPGDASWSIRQDDDQANSYTDGRKNALWGTLCGGGWGNEWYFGYKNKHSDLTLQDFRTRDLWWDYCRYAMSFFTQNDIPYTEMVNDNELTSNENDYCFFKPAEAYVVYLKNGGTTDLNLESATGKFHVKWFDPRNGGELKSGSVEEVEGGKTVSLGEAPADKNQDWAILVTKSCE